MQSMLSRYRIPTQTHQTTRSQMKHKQPTCQEMNQILQTKKIIRGRKKLKISLLP